MKVFVCDNLNGKWISAQAIIVAETKRKARNALVRELKRVRLFRKNSNPNNYNLVELDLSKPDVQLINDGDY